MSIPLPGRILPLAPRTFRALGHRNFRLLWTGQLVSLTGRWMQSVAQGWLVFRLSDSPLALGFVGFCTFAPILLFAFIWPSPFRSAEPLIVHGVHSNNGRPRSCQLRITVCIMKS